MNCSGPTSIEAIRVHTEEILRLCQSLDDMLEPGFGPNSLQTLIQTSSGQLLTINRGTAILKACHCDHPIGRLITDSIAQHKNKTGDNSKSFLLLLTGLLANFCHQKNLSNDFSTFCRNYASNNNRMAQAMNRLRTVHLPSIIIPKISSHFIYTPTRRCPSPPRSFLNDKHPATALKPQDLLAAPNHFLNNSDCEPSTISATASVENEKPSVTLLFDNSVSVVMTSIIATCLAGKYSSYVRKHLAHVLSNLLALSVASSPTMSPQTEQNWTLSELVTWMLDRFDCICIEVAGGGSSITQSRVLEGVLLQRDFKYLSEILNIKEVAESGLEKSRSIRCVLFKDLCGLEGNADDDNAIYSLSDRVSAKLAIDWAQQKYQGLVKVLRDLGVTLLLTAGRISEQLNAACINADLSTVEFINDEDIDRISESLQIFVIDSVSDLLSSDTMGGKSRVIGQLSSCRQLQLGGRIYVHLMFTTDRKQDCHSVFSTTVKHPPYPCQLLLYAPTSAMCHEIFIDLRDALKVVQTWTSHNQQLHPSISSKEMGVAISGGGTFEILVHRALRDWLKFDQMLDSYDIDACRILSSALLGLPLRLLCASCRTDCKLGAAAALLEFTCGKFLGGVNGRTGRPLLAGSDVIDSVDSKIRLIDDCLQLFEQILRLDSIVAVKSITTKLKL